jgi:hypothetical protein
MRVALGSSIVLKNQQLITLDKTVAVYPANLLLAEFSRGWPISAKANP